MATEIGYYYESNKTNNTKPRWGGIYSTLIKRIYFTNIKLIGYCVDNPRDVLQKLI